MFCGEWAGKGPRGRGLEQGGAGEEVVDPNPGTLLGLLRIAVLLGKSALRLHCEGKRVCARTRAVSEGVDRGRAIVCTRF